MHLQRSPKPLLAVNLNIETSSLDHVTTSGKPLFCGPARRLQYMLSNTLAHGDSRVARGQFTARRSQDRMCGPPRIRLLLFRHAILYNRAKLSPAWFFCIRLPSKLLQTSALLRSCLIAKRSSTIRVTPPVCLASDHIRLRSRRRLALFAFPLDTSYPKFGLSHLCLP